MNPSEISNLRLKSQQVEGAKFNSVKAVVGWMVAMQAQDFAMAKWAIGVRLPGSTDRSIEDAFIKAKILRAHLMRPTWHFVSADDFYWLHELTAPQIKAAMKSRDDGLGLTDAAVAKSNAVIETALKGGSYMTRDELLPLLTDAGFKNEDNRIYHLLGRAELDGVICSGPLKGKRQTHALTSERVPRKKSISRDSALAELAKRYISSRGPATLKDFTWWSGLSAGDARKALEQTGHGVVREEAGSQSYWIAKSLTSSDIAGDSCHLLPAYDEYIIGYSDRSPSISSADQKKAISSNGVFRPVIVLNSQVIGIWKQAVREDRVIIEALLFKAPSKKIKSLIESAAATYGQFLVKQPEMIWESR